MNDATLAPENLDQLREVIAAEKQVIPVGNETKTPLSHCPEATKISLRSLRGITQYEPSEFTFTALAGTPLTEIIEALSEKNQYLPFDPMLAGAGATIGGTVAAGLSGPGRFRYGGIRDFLLCVHFISGEGKLIRAGGKVVKNAAGFDIPKFMVGSLGRFGVMTELTFKVFPRPLATSTLQLKCDSHEQAIQRMSIAGSSAWELDAIDYDPHEQSMYLRIGGPESSNRSIANQIREIWGDDVSELEQPDAHWEQVREMQLQTDHPIVAKIPTTPTTAIELCDRLTGGLWLSAAANVAWHSMRDANHVTESSSHLSVLGMKALVVKGPSEQCCIGTWQTSDLELALKDAFDQPHKFPMLETNRQSETASER